MTKDNKNDLQRSKPASKDPTSKDNASQKATAKADTSLKMSRRDALMMSGAALTGLVMGGKANAQDMDMRGSHSGHAMPVAKKAKPKPKEKCFRGSARKDKVVF